MNTRDYPSHLGKMPPLSIEIEKAVLSVLFNDSDKFISIESVLTTQCFYKTEHQILFDAIQSIHLDNAKINATSIIRKLYDLRNSDLMDVYRSIKSEYSSSDQLFRNATLLAEFATKRALIENSQKLLSMCFNDEPMDTIDTLVSDGVNIATSRNRAIDGVKFIDSVEKMKIKMNRKLIDGLSGVTTGIKMIDNLTAGWQNDDIAIIAGRPGCFTAETLIRTEGGTKRISEVREGDMILSRDTDRGVDEYKPAINFIKHTNRTDRLFHVKLKNGSGFRVTEDHEFFINGKYVPIKDFLQSYEDEPVEWRAIKGFPTYLISNYGDIKTFNWKNTGREAIMKPALDANGYYRTMLKGEDGLFHTVKVHRLVAIAFHDNAGNLPCVNHKNSIRSDNRKSNVEWQTESGNVKHSFSAGLSCNKGKGNPASILTDEIVSEIRASYPYGRKRWYAGEVKKKDLAIKYGVSVGAIKDIITNKTWQNNTSEYFGLHPMDILSFSTIQNEDVFDITVADNHNFYLFSADKNILVSNSGKTASATFHAYEAAKAGLPVAFVSLEVEDESLTGRIVSNVSRTASSLIAKAQLAPNQKAHVEAVADQMSNLPIYYYPVSESWDINDISLVLRNWARRYGIKVIVIDFLQLITDRTIKGDNPVMVINSILYKIKKLRAILGIPFIIYSQLNRENEGKADKRPSLSGLKGSGAIEETGTVIIFLYREDYYNKAIAEAAGNDYINSDNLEYIFAKNRQGETGTMHLKCNIAQNRIYEVETKPLVPDTQLELDTGK